MADGAHWIGSVAFELRSRDAAAIDSIRRTLRADLGPVLIRPLQRALDDVDSSARVVRHRRIEVDLGVLPAGDLGSEAWTRRIAEGLGRQLAVAGRERDAAKSAATDAAEQLAAFLATGILAWPSPGAALRTVCDELLTLGEQRMAQLAAALLPLFARSPAAAERLVRQCPAKLVRRITAALADPPPNALRAAPAGVEYIAAADVRRWAAILVGLARGRAGAVATANELLSSGAAARPAGVTGAAQSETETAAALEIARRTPAADARSPHLQAEAVPISAAGVVLLYPFLAAMFAAAGLVDEEGTFNDADAQARAPLLVHFLATARSEAAEPELALAKLLCGLDLGAVVPRSIEPTALERQEAEAVIAAAIGHWRVLGETSAAALRETFLDRPGRLMRKGDDWRLTVERRGVDVLLDGLPWSINLVKTPFMAAPLAVDWR